MIELKEIFSALQQKLDENPGKVEGINATYFFNLSENGVPHQYHIAVADGVAKVNEGGVDNPSITIFMDANDFLAVASGQLNPMTAFMGGKLKLQGDMMLAMKLQSMLG